MTGFRILGLGFVLALAACAQGDGTANAPAGDLASCGANAHQDWVGKRVDVLNDVDLPEGARVLFPTTPATMDFREDRMNIAVDKSDMISRVYCG
jgi:hypothetical protein